MSQSNPYQKSAYDQVPQPGNPTYSEAWALVEAARRMAAPLEYGSLDDAANISKLREALRLNWRLWTIFQTELSVEDGPVPTNIRESMLSLCNFVDKHTVETLNNTSAERVVTLIEINRQIANGLLESLHNALDASEAEERQHPDSATPQPAPQQITSIDTDV